jgi:hypothetical protein
MKPNVGTRLCTKQGWGGGEGGDFTDHFDVLKILRVIKFRDFKDGFLFWVWGEDILIGKSN